MQIKIQKGDIIKQFKRNGFNLDNKCLQQVTTFLANSNNQQKQLKTLIKKLNQIAINSNQQFGQNMMKIAIQMLSQGTQGKFKTYDQIIQDIRKWSIMYISPYQHNQSRFFIQKPQPHLFKFDPQQVMQNDIKRFKEVEQATKQLLKSNQWIIGMLYQDFSKTTHFNDGTKSKLLLQNEANEMQIVFPQNYQHKYSLIPGCIYAVRGKYLNRNLVLTVDELILPPPLLQQKNSLSKQKFKKMCVNIHNSKNDLTFQAKDFYKYTTIYNEKRDQNKQTLIFGAVRIQKKCVQRILRLVSQYGNSVQCLIFMLDEGEHQDIDLKIWFKGINVFIVPHINSDGPRLLPKIPILKNNFNSTKILTNPAKFSIYARQALFLNLPLMKNLYEKNLFNTKSNSVILNQQQMARSLSQLLFSQSTVHICSDNYPKQTDYFQLKQQTILFVSDKACPSVQHSKDGKKCVFVSVGNFLRQGEFVCYLPKSKKIQLCEQPKN